MRKMKKVLSLAMTAAMTASLLTGMGALQLLRRNRMMEKERRLLLY